MTRIHATVAVLLVSWASVVVAAPDDAAPLIGESEAVYTLSPKNDDIRGLAFDDVSPKAPRLLVLDRSGKVFSYQIPRRDDGATGELKQLEVIELPRDAQGNRLVKPRGLAYAREGGHDVLYWMCWDDAAWVLDDDNDVISQLWRFDLDEKTSNVVDLSRYTNRIGDRELLDVACDGGDILVCYDPDGYADQNIRVQRGIVRLKWKAPYDADPEFVRHMPDAGIAPSHGLACMELEGARYLWATIGNHHIYCADGPTGRGLFYFDRPKSSRKGGSCRGLCFGNDALWVSENVAGPGRVHRVNVTKNLDAGRAGPRVVRHLTMGIKTVPENEETPHPGEVRHNYSRPYRNRQMPNQDIWPETERIVDLSDAPNATIRPFTYDPAGDVSSRQYMQSVVYADAPARPYASQYEIDVWVRPYRRYAYPHRVNRDAGKLKGTNYLEDDPELFNLTDKKTYDAFLKRIDSHIRAKYGVAADMDNPYWAARNTVEYIQDRYYYPHRSKRRPAAVDYSRKHYDANPGNLKIELTERPYDKSQIIACSGTSVMVAGTMRYLGIPARWLGTGMPMEPTKWDTNHNGLLDKGETAPCSNGHRYSQVWLGSHYGWMSFDATPKKPAKNDFDQPPPMQPQWRYMRRCAAGARKSTRIIFNVGSRLFRPLYRDFEYNERQAVNNACGGDQRYNLQGRFERPELWKGSGDGIFATNVCFIEDVKRRGPKSKTLVTWNLEGEWQRDPSATVSVALQQVDAATGEATEIATLAEAIPYGNQSAVVDLSDYRGKGYRFIVRKEGDPETGGLSETFDIP
ncbi:MAG: transglutaminase domain-containing protein [Pirellulales bacterium]|nr:transglutaminase domain-containing protein [Pirellulales bacterium]